VWRRMVDVEKEVDRLRQENEMLRSFLRSIPQGKHFLGSIQPPPARRSRPSSARQNAQTAAADPPAWSAHERRRPPKQPLPPLNRSQHLPHSSSEPAIAAPPPRRTAPHAHSGDGEPSLFGVKLRDISAKPLDSGVLQFPPFGGFARESSPYAVPSNLGSRNPPSSLDTASAIMLGLGESTHKSPSKSQRKQQARPSRPKRERAAKRAVTPIKLRSPEKQPSSVSELLAEARRVDSIASAVDDAAAALLGGDTANEGVDDDDEDAALGERKFRFDSRDVGCRVAVRNARLGTTDEGTVSAYDASKDMHLILYDNGERRWHKMEDKAFSVTQHVGTQALVGAFMGRPPDPAAASVRASSMRVDSLIADRFSESYGSGPHVRRQGSSRHRRKKGSVSPSRRDEAPPVLPPAEAPVEDMGVTAMGALDFL
jgi:hypothetical protein